MFDELRGRARYGLGVNIAAKSLLVTKDGERANHELGGMVGITQYARAEEQTFDVVASEKRNGEIRKFLGCKRRARHVVADTVDAIGAIVDARVTHEDLEKRDASSVGGKTVADSRARSRTQKSLLGIAVDAR